LNKLVLVGSNLHATKGGFLRIGYRRTDIEKVKGITRRNMMSSEIRRLYRSRDDRMIGGVCGGLGEYLNVDSTLIRLLFALFALTAGSGLLAYIIMLLIIPEEPYVENTPS
jgi:phage shock protein PspC (stress-responsive transcriptional regulator)